MTVLRGATAARVRRRLLLTLPLPGFNCTHKGPPDDLKHPIGGHKGKALQVTAAIQLRLSPIVLSSGNGLRAVGGLTYLIRAAKWGNNVTNYEQGQS
jgi:hypothetical protein